MKKLTILILSMILLMGLVGCQPTPDKPFVQSKNDGTLESAVYGDPAPEYVNGYDAPETWTELLEGDDGITIVNIDATLTIPDVTMYPVYRVAAKDITQEEADRFIKAFAGDEQLYTVSGNQRTKDVIQAEIDSILDDYENPNEIVQQALDSGEISPEAWEQERQAAYKKIEKLQEELKNAPFEAGLTAIDTTMKVIKPLVDSSEINTVQGLFLKDNGYAGMVYVQTEPNSPHGYNQVKAYYSYSKIENFLIGTFDGGAVSRGGAGGIIDKIHDLNEMKMTYDEAKAFADGIVHDRMGYTNYDVSQVCAVAYTPEGQEKDYYFVSPADMPQAYLFYYTPTVDGIPLLYYTTDTYEIMKDPNMMFNTTVYPNCLRIMLRDTEVWTVYEQSSMETVEKLNANTKMLPFDEIKDIFKRYIFLKPDYTDLFMVPDENGETLYDDGELISATFNITDIRLGYIRIPEKNNNNYGLLVPVWNFYGQQVNKYAEGAGVGWVVDENNERVFDDDPGNAFLCINAIDGSVINLDIGY